MMASTSPKEESKEKVSSDSKSKYDDLTYLPPPASFSFQQQGLREKLISKTKENPFVPLGVIFTTVVLGMGLWTMRTGDGRRAQILMRLRVAGQAFSVYAILAGVYFTAKKTK